MERSMVLKRGCCHLLNLTCPSLKPWSPALSTGRSGEDDSAECVGEGAQGMRKDTAATAFSLTPRSRICGRHRQSVRAFCLCAPGDSAFSSLVLEPAELISLTGLGV